jgi:hypothetical protein
MADNFVGTTATDFIIVKHNRFYRDQKKISNRGNRRRETVATVATTDPPTANGMNSNYQSPGMVYKSFCIGVRITLTGVVVKIVAGEMMDVVVSCVFNFRCSLI